MNKNVEIITKALASKKGEHILMIDISKLSVIADYFVICDATNTTLTKTLCDEVEDKMEELAGMRPLRKEGYREGRWIVLDYNDVIVHLFLQEEREFYNIEKLWIDGENATEYTD